MNLAMRSHIIIMILTVSIEFRNESQTFSVSLSVEAGFTLLTFVLYSLPIGVTSSSVLSLIIFSNL